MAKKDKKSKEAKKLRSAEKQKKNDAKAETKNKKLAKKLGGEEEEDDDIDTILANYQKEQEEFNEVKIEILEKHPAKRLNPTMISNPLHTKKEILLFGGETVLEGNNNAHFYNDLFTYSTENDIWRKIISKNSPLPRSSHAMCSHPSGIALLFGGEFSSPKQSTFYHYGDTWILDCDSKEWQKLDLKKSPSARSGHRLIVWKNFIILHGGFRDLGTFTTYLNDLWVFDVTDFKWYQVEFPPTHPIPDARSGHSFIPCNEGGVIYGGYTKVKARKGLQKGKVLNDCWILKMKSDLKSIKFERRKKQGQLPSPRVGCSLVYHKNRGILFGGVYDYEESEEQLDSEFYNQLYSYHIENNRWYNLTLRPLRNKKKEVIKEKTRDEDLEDILNSILQKANLNDEEEDKKELEEIQKSKELEDQEEEEDQKQMIEYPVSNQLPHPRFNATTCVVDDQLYIFGGIFERGDQEFNLNSFYSIDLGRLDGVKVFWEDLSELEKAIEDSDEEDDDDDEDEYEDDDEHAENGHDEDEEEESESEEEVPEEEEEEEEFPDQRPWLPHPKPFESLRAFYIRTGAQFLEWSISSHRDARGKYLKKIAFDLCEDRFWERREAISVAEDNLEEMGGVGEVIEKDNTKVTKRR
ncbi:KEL3 [Candida jiufengensis]|uniref:KEL3 n=1 Tax=Candida jiufengensis TaxID=497108 RepID=UPI002224CEEC|nr:KEL3 [Candida jiufengensis]KAI5954244.1 KEL3 [Candida jiufengensis]